MSDNAKGNTRKRIPFFNPARKKPMANNRPLSISICAGLLAALCFSVVAGSEKEPHPILVEAFGFGIPEAGKPEAELRREAIEDALENAEMQAYVDVDLQVCVENMRITERTIRLSSLGSAELLRILEDGYMTNSTLPLYRVHVEAQVLPPPSASPPESSVTADMNRQRPKATLIVQSMSNPELEESLHHTLAGYLRESGLHLVNSPTDPETIVLNISLAQLAGNPLMELQWKLEMRSTMGTTGSFSTERIMGNRLVPLPAQLPIELQKLGVLLAREATQLSSPSDRLFQQQHDAGH